MTIDLYPAIDLRGGKVVRLTEGDYDSETTYGDDPVAVAESFVDAGAPWVASAAHCKAGTGASCSVKWSGIVNVE